MPMCRASPTNPSLHRFEIRVLSMWRALPIGLDFLSAGWTVEGCSCVFARPFPGHRERVRFEAKPSTLVVHSRAMARVAYFVSPHGFGHAARACAVVAEMVHLRPGVRFDLFTEVPEWFFADSLPECYVYHRLSSDVGMVQLSPFLEDLDATVDRLDLSPLADSSTVEAIARDLRTHDFGLVVCDIAPLGLAAAARAGIPSVLVENITWDWIYSQIPQAPSRLRDHGTKMAEIFSSADLRIQTVPECERVSRAIRVSPVARQPRLTRRKVRSTLGVPDDENMVVVSMGGVPWDSGGFSALERTDGPWIVVPGGAEGEANRHGRLLLLPFHADIYHPDLVAASDVVVSKLGYSTVAEAYCCASALAYVERARFPESPVLARWVETNLVSAKIEENDLASGAWLKAVDKLLEVPRRRPEVRNGARQAAEIILEKFGSNLH